MVGTAIWGWDRWKQCGPPEVFKEGKKAAEMRKGGAERADAEDWPQKDANPIPKKECLMEAVR